MTVDAAGLSQEIVAIPGGDVGTVPVDQRHQRRHVERVHLEIDVEEPGDASRARREAGLERLPRPIALVVDRVEARVLRAQIGDDAPRVVLRAVVD